ncbi:MAG TPA: bifunctional (p)ppGpp synthetase/guanosine-3',5'-bis(diphosphate) 3'-pyrophosphohydrolase [Steroidobacteraceae bacterium]|nr:bifunctional (p)ppGpp synthetase/guanosine-3',5'-bis(diphosphate) 3'-pyrophosphohydrolase [Steroidobacteraceae bacterium]
MKTTTSGAAAGAAVLDDLRAALDSRAAAVDGWAPARQQGDETAGIIAALDAERDIVAGALVQPLVARGLLSRAQAVAAVGEGATALAEELGRLGEFRAGAPLTPGRSLSGGQADALRRMLLAVVTDPRLVLVRLADQLRRMRRARELDEAARLHLAWETREIYAPLANRLGIWQLKWELEDLSFRWLEPGEYRRIAGWLNESRIDRERYIESVIAEISAELARAGIEAEVLGRPKHIYSIWRKMHRKNLAFEQVFDVRAVRVITSSVEDCYAALGVVHGRWHYIAGEFDDYIATPKDNLYRSLHTAVLGPAAVPVEIQIRTREMHDHAELGVAAHWRYKEGAARDAAYDRKIEWLRELLAPATEAESDADFLTRVRAELFDDRVYALTPKGEVVDLPSGATPIDFAYHVHTELGHRCRGARVNGRIVPLNHRLANGEVVEIIGGKKAQPSRDWLVEREGFLASPRSRAKVRAWFKRQDMGVNQREGREILERELTRLGAEHALVSDLIGEFGLSGADALYLAIGSGELGLAQVAGAIERRQRGKLPPGPAADLPPIGLRRKEPAAAVEVEGVGDLLSTHARCCNPVPPEPVTGYVTVGRGITLHRSGCRNLARLAARAPQRLLQVEWGKAAGRRYPVEIVVHAMDRRGLLRDITTAVAEERIDIERLASQGDAAQGSADLSLRVAVGGLEELTRLLARLAAMPGIISARRRA